MGPWIIYEARFLIGIALSVIQIIRQIVISVKMGVRGVRQKILRQIVIIAPMGVQVVNHRIVEAHHRIVEVRTALDLIRLIRIPVCVAKRFTHI